MNQLSLFDEPKSTHRLGGGPPDVQRLMELAFSEPVKAELVSHLNDHVGQWLTWADFADIRERHNISFCLGHVLYRLVREGRAIEKRIYFGAERPGELQPYLGFTSVYSSIEHAPAPQLATVHRPTAIEESKVGVGAQDEHVS